MRSRIKVTFSLVFSLLLYNLMLFMAYHHNIIQYLVKMGFSQAGILCKSVPLETYLQHPRQDSNFRHNLRTIEHIKRFSVEEVGLRPTEHYTRIYPDEGKNLLWVVSASEVYQIKAFQWSFPLLGKLGYKGYFNKEDAEQEKRNLQRLGYDVEVGPVTAWSSLGWWQEPLPEKLLYKNKADFCALLFHELFHSTYYKANELNLNENLADFVAEKACQRYLKEDQEALMLFLKKRQSSQKTAEFMLKEITALNRFYDSIRHKPDRAVLKASRFKSLLLRIEDLTFLDSLQKRNLQKDVLLNKNAAFISYQQYRGLQDSLEFVFNNFYGGQIKKMVRSLEQDR